MITPEKGSKSARSLYRMGRSRKDGFSLNIETVLERSRESSIIEARKRKIERIGFTQWGIWKLLRIEWE
jgi:hypothetical protein